jgi:hypothetical protein
MPADQGKRDQLGKEVASPIRKSLKNPDGFDDYKVLFVTLEKNGPVSRSNYTGHLYK